MTNKPNLDHYAISKTSEANIDYINNKILDIKYAEESSTRKRKKT